MTAQTFSAQAKPSPITMVFKPAADRTRWEGLAVLSWVFLIDLALVAWLLNRSADGISFFLFSALLLSLPLLAHLILRLWGAFSLRYTIDRNAMRIRWATECVVIPLVAIEKIIADGAVASLDRSPRHWPAPFMRPLARNGGVNWEMYSTRPPQNALWLQTAETLFSISPADPEGFLAALQEYHRLGPSHALSVSREHPRLCSNALQNDRLGRWLLIFGLVGVFVLFAFLFFPYPNLPDRLIFHYNESGLPDSIRPKSALFLLPSIGLAAYLVNSLAGMWMVCRRQRAGAYLLWSSTLSVQIFSLLALFSLTR